VGFSGNSCFGPNNVIFILFSWATICKPIG
jgi:hypothetical protein